MCVCLKAAHNMFLILSCSAIALQQTHEQTFGGCNSVFQHARNWRHRNEPCSTETQAHAEHSLRANSSVIVCFTKWVDCFEQLWSFAAVYSYTVDSHLYWLNLYRYLEVNPVLGAHWCTHIKPSPPVWLDYKSRRLTICLKIVLWDGCMVHL